ncbi:MAG: Brp/Blh family beta-carotene 15,15'-dioxygenase [Salinibacter sp.]|uniref:Brp/Blh family beta-carotene 15,15'-dioxygenase n=1 Tax=Salinibacter sp. TaxID=2065818 RepID=UPI002FC3696B
MDDPVTLRSPRVYAGVLALTLLAVGVGAWGGVSLGPSALGVLFVAVVLTGMPHGAIDHLVAARLWGLDSTWSDQAKFYGGYLVLMALYGALWIVAPAWSLGLFLVMTMYHFGQADLAYWRLPPLSARLVYLSRGLFLIGLPIVAFPEVVAPIFAAMGDVQLLDWPLVMTAPGVLFGGLVVQHAVALGLAVPRAAPSADWAPGREAINVAVLTALFGLVHPLVAFSVFFGGWHALGHILELLRFFRRRGEAMSMVQFYREAALFTVIPFVGLAGLYVATQSFGLQDQMIALLFILIAIMTLPHMMVVEKLYWEREKDRPRAVS